MKKPRILITSLLISALMVNGALAGTWQETAGGRWKYINDDGTCATGWVHDDGKDYYLDENGVLLTDTRTPDGYHVDGSGAWDGQTPSRVITAGGASSDPGGATSLPDSIYPAGSYQVGTEIPAGEYVLIAMPSETEPYYAIYTGEQAEDYNSFTYNAIIRIADGQSLVLESCAAAPIEEMPRIDLSKGEMFKVGYHISAGTYRLRVKEGEYGIYYTLSYPSDRAADVIDGDYVTDATSVTVEDGQYLQLLNCVIAEKVTSEEGGSEDGQEVSSRSQVVTSGAPSLGLATSTSVPATVYDPGIHEAGKEMPAGEYVLFPLSDEETASYQISSVDHFDDNKSIREGGNILKDAIITVRDGEFVNLIHCSASPIEEVPQIDYRQGNHFKVGYHIPAGTYYLKEDDVLGFYIILSAPGLQSENVVKYSFVYGGATPVTVTDGQYLLLASCSFTAAPGPESIQSGGSGSRQVEDELRTSPVIATRPVSSTLSRTTSVPSTVYAPGRYEIGKDIPAGEYVLLTDNPTDSISGAYEIRSNAEFESAEDVIDYGMFRYNDIVRLTEGQFIGLEGCSASPIDEVPNIDYRKGEAFKVGYHIPAGTYEVESTSDYYYGHCTVFTDPADMTNTTTDQQSLYDYGSVTVRDGDYIRLVYAALTGSNNVRSSTGPKGGSSGSYAGSPKSQHEGQPSPVITVGGSEASDSVAADSGRVYPDGKYQVGVDIPAGEYIAFGEAEDFPYYEIRSNDDFSSYSDIIDNCLFDYNAIFYLEDGQFLDLSDCTAYPLESAPQIDPGKGEMYKVGYHIPAGACRLRQISDERTAYFTVLSKPTDDREDSIRYDSFQGETTINVADGQYLRLQGCVWVE